MIDSPPPLTGVLETALYVRDLEASEAFYRRLFGFPVLSAHDRLRALDVGGRQVLLLFLHGGSVEPIPTDTGTIPPHDARGESHLAFAVPTEALEAWRERLQAQKVEIVSEVGWERGGRSLYFRDPDGHLIELVTPGVWETY